MSDKFSELFIDFTPCCISVKLPLLTRDISVPTDRNQSLNGVLTIPEGAKGIVLFAHGSGSDKNSPRNERVSNYLNANHIATCVMNLLTSQEIPEDEVSRKLRFDIDLISRRLSLITKTIVQSPDINMLPVGYYGASTGAAAALNAATILGNHHIRAIVCRGGRVDLAKSSVAKIRTAVLLLVGGNDFPIVEINQRALKSLDNALNKRLVIVPGAGHTFEEAGAIEEVAKHTCSWFETYFK